MLFFVLAVFAVYYDRFPLDETGADAIQDIDVPALGGFLDFVNFLGHRWVYVVLTLGFAAAFALARAGTEAILLVLTFAPPALNSLVKDWVERPRPSTDLVRVTNDASGFGFPSGHTVGTTALFGLLFFLIPIVVLWRPARWILQLGCLLMVVASGPARVYVGAHWPSDVVAGYVLAFVFLLPAVAFYRRARPGAQAVAARSPP